MGHGMEIISVMMLHFKFSWINLCKYIQISRTYYGNETRAHVIKLTAQRNAVEVFSRGILLRLFYWSIVTKIHGVVTAFSVHKQIVY